MNKNFFKHIKSDFPASIVVFLVALPLCLGIALASGAPLFSGIIAGIVGGTLVAIISGSPLGVSGPAAGLAVIVLNAIEQLGSFEVFLFAVVVAGIIQFILGLLKAGVIGYYFPSSVIKGMLSGIGIIIILKQIPHALGHDLEPEGSLSFFQTDGHNTISELWYMLSSLSPGAILISTLSLAILILWERPFIKNKPIFNLIQGPLIVVLLGIGLNLILSAFPEWALRSNQIVNLPVTDSIPGFFSQFTFPDFSQWHNPEIYTIALTLAIVASLETLLCVEATDKMDPQKRVTPTNREMLAQGVGNTFSGLVGGLPITQVIVRSSANIQSGGKTKLSAIIHGILLFICAMSIPHLLNLIPLSSLAAILLVVGYKLAKPSLIKSMFKRGFNQFAPFIITIIGLVFTDMLIGIGMGMAVAIIQILWNNFKIPYHFNPEDYTPGEPVKIELSEDVSFLNKASILQTLNQMPHGAKIVLDATKARNIHPDVLEIIEDFTKTAGPKDIQVKLIGFESDYAEDPVKRLHYAVWNNNQDKNGKLSNIKAMLKDKKE